MDFSSQYICEVFLKTLSVIEYIKIKGQQFFFALSSLHEQDTYDSHQKGQKAMENLKYSKEASQLSPN